MLETVRHYASERLTESGETEGVRSRHRDAFLELAERVASEPVTARQAQWLELLDPEASNLAAALDWAVESDGERALRLGAALHLWWRLRRLFSTAERGFARALEAADPAPSPFRARVLSSHAHLLVNAGDFMPAIDTAQKALAMAEQVDDDLALAGALDILGTIQLFADPVGCRPLLERSRELASRSGDNWCLIDATQMLTWSFLICDEYEEGERLLGEVLPLIERTGYRDFVISWYWFGMSFGPLMRADADRFFELADRALAAAEEVGDPVVKGGAHASQALGDEAFESARAEGSDLTLEEVAEWVRRTRGTLVRTLPPPSVL